MKSGTHSACPAAYMWRYSFLVSHAGIMQCWHGMVARSPTLTPPLARAALAQFAPDEAAFSQPRREAWNEALNMLHHFGVLTSPAAGSRVPGKGDDGRIQKGGAQSGGRGGQRRTPLGAERRSKLLKVLMICEANIFGDSEDDGEVHTLISNYVDVSPADACTLVTIDRAGNECKCRTHHTKCGAALVG